MFEMRVDVNGSPHRLTRRSPSDRLALARTRRQQGVFGSGKAAVLNAVEHLGHVQIDTISVVQRAHHHVLWSRIPDYQSAMLHALHEQIARSLNIGTMLRPICRCATFVSRDH